MPQRNSIRNEQSSSCLLKVDLPACRVLRDWPARGISALNERGGCNHRRMGLHSPVFQSRKGAQQFDAAARLREFQGHSDK